MPPVIDREKCSGCGICADICPTDVFYIYEKGQCPAIEYEEECWHCNACVLDCPEQALTLRIALPAMMLHVDSVMKGPS